MKCFVNTEFQFPNLVVLLNSGPVSLNAMAIGTCGEIVQTVQGGLVFLVRNSGSAPLVIILLICSLLLVAG